MSEDNKASVRESLPDDIFLLKDKLRESDKTELALCHSTPFAALLEGLIASDEAYSILVGEEVCGMFGVKKDVDNVSVWFLGSDTIDKHPKLWSTIGREYINKFFKKYGVLTNIVWIGNKSHIKWLKRMGALFSTTINNTFKQFFIIKEA